MGHGGRDTYQDTISSILDQCPATFTNKVLHLKTRAGEESKAENIKSYCDEFGIRVIETIGSLVHHSQNMQNHSAEYFKDVFKAYSDIEIRKNKYSFWLEDDWIIKNKSVSVPSAIEESISFLDKNPDQLCVRFNSSDAFLREENDHIRNSDMIFTQSESYTRYGPTFTFQPNINRTSEIFAAWKAAQNYLSKLSVYHCELMSGDILKHFTNCKTPFSFFNPELIYSQHIG